MTVRLECFCPHAGVWHVSVDGDAVDATRPDHADETGWGDDTIPLPSIDALYRIAVGRANSSPWPSPWSRPITTYRVVGEGIPREVRVDQWGVGDEEFGWTIEHFEAQPSP